MSRSLAFAALAWCLVALLISPLAGLAPQREGTALRRRASGVVVVPRAADLPRPIENVGSAARQHSVRARVDALFLLSVAAPLPDRAAFLPVVGGPQRSDGGWRVPILLRDGTPSPSLLAAFPPEQGEETDAAGRPLRWARARASARQAPLCDGDHPAIRLGSLVFRKRNVFPPPLLAPFDAEETFARARRYKLLVERAASRFGLSQALLYAIIHNESDFSPAQISRRSATGLMQVLPGTGGEVHGYLHSREADAPAADLNDPEMNIHYGAAYLHLLLHRYLGGVRDLRAREYCAIAGYNMGPGRLLRFFADSREQAVERINRMTPEELFQRLVTALPLVETRFFVAKVERSRAAFARFR